MPWIFKVLCGAAMLITAMGSMAQTSSMETAPSGNMPIGLVDCWYFNTASAPADSCGSGGALQFAAGTSASVIAAPGYSSPVALRLARSGYFSEPGQAYSPSNGYSYRAASAATATWGDGKPHTLVMLMQFDQFEYTKTGTRYAAGTVLIKNGEYSLSADGTGGGTLTLRAGTTLESSISAAPYASSPIAARQTQANPLGAWYMVALSYDGKGEACIALNDSTQSECVPVIAMTQSSSPVLVGPGMTVQYLLAFNRVLSASDRASLFAAGPSASGPSTSGSDSSWPDSSAAVSGVTLTIPGSPCVHGDGWRSTYRSGGYVVPSPYATCTVETNSPSLTIDEELLQDLIGDESSVSAQLELSVDNAEYGIFPYTEIFPAGLGHNAIQVALPGDGLTHSVTITVSSYVGYSGSDTTPTSQLAASVVQQLAVPSGYTLTPVSAKPIHNLWLFYGDSISLGSETSFVASDGYISQLRDSGAYHGDIIYEAYGGRALFHDMPTDADAAHFADTLTARYGCPARFTAETMTNDYGRKLQRASSGAQHMAAFWAKWNSICPATINYQQSAFLRKSEAANPLGDTLATWRAAMAAACSAAKSCINIDATTAGYPGPDAVCPNSSGLPLGAGFPSLAADGLHLTTCGAGMARAREFAEWSVVQQEIRFNMASSVPYGTATVTLDAVATSGGPIQYKVLSGPAKLQSASSDQLNISGAGTVVLSATQAGDATHQPATTSWSFAVTPAVLTVTANSATFHAHAPLPPLTYTVSGFVGQQTASSTITGTADVATQATSASVPGSYPIEISAGTLTARNYVFQFVDGTLTLVH